MMVRNPDFHQPGPLSIPISAPDSILATHPSAWLVNKITTSMIINGWFIMDNPSING